MNGCCIEWDWQPPYGGAIHKRHVCGSHDEDGAHVCANCRCWVTDEGLKYYGVTI